MPIWVLIAINGLSIYFAIVYCYGGSGKTSKTTFLDDGEGCRDTEIK